MVTPPATEAGAAARLLRLLPQRADYRGLASSWRADLLSGVTVAVVALPLALGLGITTGMGAAAGVTTAIVAGFIAAVFGGSSVQVSGFSASMTVVITTVVSRFGPSGVYTVTLLAGVLLVAAALAGLAQFVDYVPWPVIEGFTVGVALTIALQQVPAALGVPRPPGQNPTAVAVRALWHVAGQGSGTAVAIFGAAVVVMLVVPRLDRRVPAPLAAVLITTVAARVLDLRVTLIGKLPRSLPAPSLPSLSPGRVSELFGAAGSIAALAAIESLLSSKVADTMGDGPPSDPDRELLGQGLANLISPMFGGMPSTGVLARTAVNIRSGARTRFAAASHALILLLLLFLAAGAVGDIPVAALAGVLVVTAARTLNVASISSVLRATKSDAAVFVLTTATTLVFDLIVSIEVGVAVAVVLALRSVARTAMIAPQSIADSDEVSASLGRHIVAYRLTGALFFGAAHRFLTEITADSDAEVVILRLPQLQMLDATGARALGEIVEQLQGRGVTVLLKGPLPQHERTLRAVGVLDQLTTEKHVFATLDEAIAHARVHVARIRHGEASA